MKNYILILTLLLTSLLYSEDNKKQALSKSNYNVTIYRDDWGVPHIYGETDKDAAFGLAYAHAEDDFKTIQDVLLALRGNLASVKGMKAAPVDYLVGLLRIWEMVDNKYESELSQDMRLVCEGYADGINRYIEKHPNQAIKELYPVSGKDIVAGFVFRTPLMFGLDRYIAKLLSKEKPKFSKHASRESKFSMYGSNVIAVNPSRSEDQSTRIAINSHQPWVGPVAWYEVHIHSQEGWNVSGGLFPGSPVIFKGYNEHLAWSHTVNSPDLIDIYELTINPDNDKQYWLDGEWVDFKIEKHPIKVKILGPIKWTFKRDLIYSEHGPVLKAKHGVYAIRYSGNNLIGQVEQWYRMNKSTNLKEFKDALKMMQIPMFNTVYADKGGNIFYLYNGLIPKRKSGYKWDDILPGDKRSLIWDSYYEFNELPQTTNPKSGYLQNCNSSPYLATVGEGNPKKSLPDNTGIETFQTNRAYRANELYGEDLSITKEEFYSYKYDTYYSKKSVMKYALDRFLKEVETKDPQLLAGIELLKNWDLGNQKDNTGAALAMLTFKLTYDIKDFKYDYSAIMKQFKKSITFLNKEFGRIDIPLGDLQVLKRGELELPLDGAPDVLRAIYSKKIDGKKIATHGDCFFQIVEWDKDGNLSAQSIHQFGSATIDKKSKHYSDQSKLFNSMEMKPSIIDFKALEKSFLKSYKP